MIDPVAQTLYAELHARPLPSIRLPSAVWQVLIMTTPQESEEVIQRFYSLNDQQAPASKPNANKLLIDLGHCEVRLEMHREFCSFLFIQHEICESAMLDEAPPFSQQWLGSLPGKLLISNSVKLLPEKYREINKHRIRQYFDKQRVLGSYLLDRKATVWTSFRLHNDNARYLVFVADLTEIKTGYLLQQLVEFEAYRILALLAFPKAKELIHELANMDEVLADILRRFPDAEHVAEQQLLLEITNLSARVEAIQLEANYRFRATRAYTQLVNERLDNLQEEPFDDVSTMQVFLRRRFSPAIRTCESVQEELQQLSNRVASASHLLQVRVNVAMGDQNKALLSSMDKRGHEQLLLQETVEGLSVAAISYYIIGLLEKIYKLGEKLPWLIDSKTLTAISILPVVLFVWLGVRKVRTRINKKTAQLTAD